MPESSELDGAGLNHETKQVRLLSGQVVLRTTRDSDESNLRCLLLKSTGIPPARQCLTASPQGWTLTVHGPPHTVDPITCAFLWDCAHNPVRGLWVSDQGSCVIDEARELGGRLRYREPTPEAHTDVGLLHALMEPVHVQDGRLWWRAPLYRCPHDVADYLASGWWNTARLLVGVVFLATHDSGRALELRTGSLESTGIFCEAICETTQSRGLNGDLPVLE